MPHAHGSKKLYFNFFVILIRPVQIKSVQLIAVLASQVFTIRIFTILVLTGLILMNPALMTDCARADIYSYVDRDGIMHFTNTPTSSNYRLYLKEKRAGGGRIQQVVDRDQYDPIIRRAQKKYGVDFFLIKAVIEVESAFNSRAVSKKGAKGLMQIMPFNYKVLSVKDPFNPSQNIMGGTRYLKALFDRYKNRLPLVLAAYNAGPQAVDQYNTIPPYKETQRYVEKVMSAYQRYKDS